MASFILDNFPLVTIKFNENFGDEKEFDKFENILLYILKKCDNNKLKLIFDVSDCKCPSLAQIYKHGKFMIDNDINYKKSVDRTAILVPSDTWLWYIDILFSFRPASRPNLVTTDYNDVLNFMITQSSVPITQIIHHER
jgi:hypothetical protein